MSYIDKGIKSILNQNLFDEDYYSKNYGDELDTDNYLTHYIYLGYKEGKNPSNDFDTLYYLHRYSDLNDMNPLIHYVLWGKNEHRFKSLEMELNYIKIGMKAIINQNLFNETFYINKYGEEIHGINPLSHYISFGFKEGKNPSPTFETNFYLKKYPDAWNQNPLIHYALYGRKKGNFTNSNQLNPYNDLDKAIKIIKENNLFDCEFYLDYYYDVKKSGKCPVEHYMKVGFNENRKMKPEYDFENYVSENKLSADINPLFHFLLNNNDISNLKIKKSLSDYITNDIKNYLESKYFVSVIMPTYNRKNVIKNAIDSVINQTFSSYELIIIDDGSIDGTENLLKLEYNSLFDDGKIKYIKTNNNGVSKARNIGLNNCEGNVIAYLDSDNIWHEDYLKKMIYVLDKYECDSCYSAIKVHDNNKMFIKVRDSKFNREDLLKENFIDLNVFIHKKKLFDKFGGFDEQLTRLVDWDLLLRYTADSEPYFLKEILADYFIDNSLKNISLFVNLEENKEKIIKKYSLDTIWNNDKMGIFLVTNHSEHEDLNKITEILDKIYSYTASPFDLLVIDNNSDVKFKEFLNSYSDNKDNMEVILLGTNIFTSPALNIALNKLNNEFVIYLSSNEDFILKPGWELNAVDLMKNNPNMGIAGNLISYPLLFNEDYFKNNKWFKNMRNHYLIENECKKLLNFIHGDCFIIRKKVFEALGGFNPKMPQQHWDIEYSYYIESEGWELGQVPNWI